MVPGQNTLRSSLGVGGYESYNVHTGLTRQVPSSASTAAEGGVGFVGENFTPSALPTDEADLAEQLLLRWNQTDTTPDNLGGSAQIAKEVGFQPPQASAHADPGNLTYLAGGGLDFEAGGIGSNLLNGSGTTPVERETQSHEGWNIR